MQGPDLVINQKKDLLDNMDEWCKTHHAASGKLFVFFFLNTQEICVSFH
jgi:oligoribonuclease (3'-5' exoribonuclease)